MEESKNRQAVTGFKVVSYQVKRVKDSEKLKLVLEADIDEIGCGECDMGDFQKALLHHRVSDIDIGFSVLVEKL